MERGTLPAPPSFLRAPVFTMYIAPSRDSRFAIVSDCRLRTDAQLDDTELSGSPHVLDMYRAAREALGRDYLRAQTLALFDYRGAELATPEERRAARAELHAYLRGRLTRATVVIPTADMTEDLDPQKADTIAWGIFGAPDSLSNMRGCFFEWMEGCYVVPVWGASPGLKVLQQWETRLWISRAAALSRSGSPLLPSLLYTEPSRDAVRALVRMTRARAPIAVDIESIEATGTITAIGVSDGTCSVSLPWEAFHPHGAEQMERALKQWPEGAACGGALRDLLSCGSAKVFHNHTFDVPRLEAKGLHVNGRIEDTFAASAIAHPELRHGLQAACATNIPVPIPPWKSLWHPKLKGVSRDDIEFWTCDPAALRDYNARDAFYTWHLAAALLPQVEREWA